MVSEERVEPDRLSQDPFHPIPRDGELDRAFGDRDMDARFLGIRVGRVRF